MLPLMGIIRLWVVGQGTNLAAQRVNEVASGCSTTLLRQWPFRNKNVCGVGMNGIPGHQNCLKSARIATIPIGINRSGRVLKNKPARCLHTEPAKETTMTAHRDSPENIIKLTSPNVKGGKKHKFIAEHTPEILRHYEQFGTESTLQTFHLKKITLEAILNTNNHCPRCGIELSIDEDGVLACELCGYRQYYKPEQNTELVPSELKQSMAQRREMQRRIRRGYRFRLGERVKQLESKIAELEKQQEMYKIQLEMAREARNQETRQIKAINEAFYCFTSDMAEYLSNGLRQVFKILLDRGFNVQKYLPLPDPKPNLSPENLIIEGSKTKLRKGLVKSIPDNPLLQTIVRLEEKDKSWLPESDPTLKGSHK